MNLKTQIVARGQSGSLHQVTSVSVALLECLASADGPVLVVKGKEEIGQPRVVEAGWCWILSRTFSSIFVMQCIM